MSESKAPPMTADRDADDIARLIDRLISSRRNLGDLYHEAADALEEQASEIAALRRRVAQMEPTLKFYADFNNWKYRHAGYPGASIEIAQSGASITAPAGKSLGDAMDLGQRARAALSSQDKP